MAGISIDAGEFARNALKAHAEGRLACQSRSHRNSDTGCYFREETGLRCIIGSGVSVDQARQLQAFAETLTLDSSIKTMIKKGFIAITSNTTLPEEITAILHGMQYRHDAMLSSDCDAEHHRHEAVMLRHLQKLKDLHPTTES